MEIEPVLDWNSAGASPLYDSSDAGKPTHLFHSTSPETVTTTVDADGRAVVERFISDQYHYGITIHIGRQGLIGKFDIFAFVTVLLQGLVLLGTAGTVTRMAALYMMGDKSIIYKSYCMEKLDAAMLYARFAIQSLVAASLFKALDGDGSGTLSVDELSDAIFCDFAQLNLKQQTADALSSFVSAQCAKVSSRIDQVATKGAANAKMSKTRSRLLATDIKKAEFIECFVDQSTSISMLRELLYPKASALKPPVWLTGEVELTKFARIMEQSKSMAVRTMDEGEKETRLGGEGSSSLRQIRLEDVEDGGEDEERDEAESAADPCTGDFFPSVFGFGARARSPVSPRLNS